MLATIGKRLLQAIPILFAVSIFSFILMKLAPGDPSLAYISPEMDLIDIEKVRKNMGLDEPLYVQYLNWLGNVLRGNLGYSIINKKSVLKQILERLPQTIGLMGSALIFSLIIGIFLGVICASKHNSWIDKSINLFSYVAISIPSFWFAMMLILVFSLQLNWLPSVGMRSTGEKSVVDLVRHSIMPIAVLSINRIAVISRYVRNAMLLELKQDYIKVAKAMGASRAEILFKYALKNSILPIITLIGLSLPSLISGSFITESIFGWPGLGLLGMNAIFSYDYPLIMATTMFSSVMLILGNLLSDIIYSIVDPRIKGGI